MGQVSRFQASPGRRVPSTPRPRAPPTAARLERALPAGSPPVSTAASAQRAPSTLGGPRRGGLGGRRSDPLTASPSNPPTPCRKRQLSPQSKSSSKVTSVPGKASDAGTATAVSTGTKSGKASTLSRREELLKQLKAVEDAIARKRAKIPGKV